MLSEIKQYLQERKSASLQEISYHFDTEMVVIEEMMKVWVKKGKVKKETVDQACGEGCHSSCGSHGDKQVYHWLE